MISLNSKQQAAAYHRGTETENYFATVVLIASIFVEVHINNLRIV